MNPQSPTSSLPPLRNLHIHSPTTIAVALINLRALYWPMSHPQGSVRFSRARTGERFPDSGYASAEDDEDKDDVQEQERQTNVLRADSMERAFVIRWLTSLIARSQEWTLPCADDQDREDRAQVVEEAVTLLALCADTQTDGALTRRFVFPVHGGDVVVELRDEPMDAGKHDHESVGLQTWGSACVLAGRICADPGTFGLASVKQMRVLELGAGTGLLSMVVAKLCVGYEVVATDLHPAVLENLRGNVARNLLGDVVRVEELDWARSPVLTEKDKYDVILAADVIYDARHGSWIKRCAEGLLRRCGVLWMIVPRRPTREGEMDGVNNVFTTGEGIRILSVDDFGRRRGVGRADEAGYRLFKIGWE